MNYNEIVDTPIMTVLYNVQFSITLDIFRKIFGNSANYLWEKFSEAFNYNLLGFFNYLDLNNKRLFCKYINENE